MTRHQIEILIDGECPLCRREAALLQRLDRGRGRLKLTDISDMTLISFEYGVTHAEAMSTIHGVREDGKLVTGMEVFRGAYRAVGLGWVLAPTGWPLFRPFFDLLYRSFARHRLRLTGRCADERCVTSDGAGAG